MTLLSVPHSRFKPDQWGINPAHVDAPWAWTAGASWAPGLAPGKQLRLYGKLGAAVPGETGSPTEGVGAWGRTTHYDGASSTHCDHVFDWVTQPWTLTIVFSTTDTTGGAVFFGAGSSASGTPLAILQNRDTSGSAGLKFQLRDANSDSYQVSLTGTPHRDGLPHTVVVRWTGSGGVLRAWLDGTELPDSSVSNPVDAVTSFNTFTVGSIRRVSEGLYAVCDVGAWGIVQDEVWSEATVAEYSHDPFKPFRPDYSQFWGKVGAGAAPSGFFARSYYDQHLGAA